jgi:hypothetical protein
VSKVNLPPWRATPEGDYMITLEDWNSQRRKYWSDCRAFSMHPNLFSNGILCPKCDGSLHDTTRVLSTAPTVLQVKCMNQTCDFKGERYE